MKKNYGSWIYLANKDKFKIDPFYKLAYTHGDYPNKIFIGTESKYADKWSPKEIASILGHEELHEVLRKDIHEKASQDLDNISMPIIFQDEHDKILNPKSMHQLNLKLIKQFREADKESGNEREAKFKILVDKLEKKNFGSFGEENDDDIVINLGRKIAEKHRRQLSGLKDIAQDVDQKKTPVTGFLITDTGIKRLIVYPKDKPKIAGELFRKAESRLITEDLQGELAKKLYNKDTFFMLDKNKKARVNRLIRKNIETTF